MTKSSVLIYCNEKFTHLCVIRIYRCLIEKQGKWTFKSKREWKSECKGKWKYEQEFLVKSWFYKIFQLTVTSLSRHLSHRLLFSWSRFQSMWAGYNLSVWKWGYENRSSANKMESTEKCRSIHDKSEMKVYGVPQKSEKGILFFLLDEKICKTKTGTWKINKVQIQEQWRKSVL